MRVRYVANKNSGVCPDLTDGKEYEVEDEFDMPDGEHRYEIWDDEEDALVATPYPAVYFETVG